MTEPKASETRGSLAWPDHDTGPVPPPQYRRRERDEDRLTRKPLAFWDRVKFLVLLAGAFGVFVWAAMSDNALLPFGETLNGLSLKNELKSSVRLVAGCVVKLPRIE